MQLLPDAPESALLDLVERIQQEPPYSYKPGEIRPAADWFPPLVEKSHVALVATAGSRPVGYCVSLPVVTYGKLNDLLSQLAIEPETTEYLAELAVDSSVRRQGIASAVLDRMRELLPPTTTTVLLRTLTENTTAIAFYQRHGYQVVDGVQQVWNGRQRLFLTRRNRS
ncbi:GNAT family N-acetyltransferase [Kribbella sp. NPDC026596]|uniref:GNAT family N-acetyltransferase n=1 Tax=Kribbella sp. NPDC026596 TaxID=3155122 RepID=UPI0033DBD1DA